MRYIYIGAWRWRDTTAALFSLPVDFFVSFSLVCNRGILISFWAFIQQVPTIFDDDFLSQYRFVFIPDHAVSLQRFLCPYQSALFYSHVTTNDRGFFYSLQFLFGRGTV